ncbi:mitotic apparatus protein p62-like isoform X1 [Macrobrachium rosenbergii]|uniref:mitotic apparatus protein p62-like isoform X1 n=1 Tax=Macrobrachium rosenbergii TaxID=79674 RepID=UPI0034D473FD
MARGGMEKSFFWGVKLDSSNKEIKWDGTTTENEEECTVCAHTLSIRQAVLGPEASDDHVVEIETTGFDNKKIRVPVCVMKAGGPHVISFEVLLEDQEATFHLVQGSGPIYLSGTHQTETTVIWDDDVVEGYENRGGGEDDDDDDEDDVEEMPVKKKAKK